MQYLFNIDLFINKGEAVGGSIENHMRLQRSIEHRPNTQVQDNSVCVPEVNQGSFSGPDVSNLSANTQRIWPSALLESEKISRYGRPI